MPTNNGTLEKPRGSCPSTILEHALAALMQIVEDGKGNWYGRGALALEEFGGELGKMNGWYTVI
jgi:hypothetical protein